MKKFAFLLFVLLLASVGAARAQPLRVDAVEVELVAAQDAAVPGATLPLGLRIRHDPHWHTYWRFPGDSGLPTRIDLRLPEGWRAGEIAWPAPKRINIGPLGNYGYDGEIVLPVAVDVPAGATGPVKLAARAQWLMCREVCVPGEADVELTLPVRAHAGPSRDAPLFERARASTPRATLPVQVFAGADTISLAFERPAVARAEFFPYRDGLVAAVAPQKLYRVDGHAGRWRLDVQARDGSPNVDAWLASAPGIVVVDGQAFELDASRAAAPAAAAGGGTLVATALGEAAGIPQGGGLSSLLSGATSRIDGPGSGGTVSAQAASLALAALFAALGGLLLNLMPCVFPVIGLKVLGFAAHADDDGAQRRRGALAFGAGVLLSFWALAGLLIALRAAGESIGWGFQLQSPAFVTAMAMLFVLMGLNFAGVFEIGTRLTQLGGLDPLHTAAHSRTTAAFGSGMLAVLVATPCTAPFMGSALGYTLGRPAAEVLLVFGAIAVGMALPYVLLGLYPRALRWLPRPGRWMESFRQFLAFPMFATVAWLAWVLGQQAGLDAVLALAIGAVLVALGAWLYGRFVQSRSAVHRALAGLSAAIALGAGLWVAWPGTPQAGAPPASGAASAAGAASATPDGEVTAWLPWSEARVAEARGQGRPVFVEFTAAWCVSCQVNKKLVLEREPVASAMARRNVVKLRADWTNRDDDITRELARHGRNGVPLYLVFVPGQDAPRLLPEILTAGTVLDAFDGR